MKIHTNNFETEDISSWETTYLVEKFINCSWRKEVYIHEKATVHCLVLIDETTDIDLSFVTKGPEATVHIYALLLGKEWTDIQADIHAHLSHDYSSAHLHLISFLPTWAKIQLDGWVTIHPQVSKWSWHLLEENIILGEWIQIKTLPMLDVHSNDVSASHGARIEKLDAKKLFYAQSRGLSDSEAKWLLIHGYFSQCFAPFIVQDSSLEKIQEQLYTELLSR